MQLTLLEYVQTILSALNLDQVNSISDTPESIQVAQAVKTSYMNLLGRLRLPEHTQMIQLDDSDLSTPVLMLRPAGVNRIDWIKYFNTNPQDGNKLQTDQFGAFSHGVNVDLVNSIGWSTTSVTSNTINTGLVTWTISNATNINPGDVMIAFNGNNFMSGTVHSISGLTLVGNITQTGGGGTFNVWTLSNSSTLPVGPGYQEVCIIPVEEFVRYVSTFNPQQTDVGSFELTLIQDQTGLPQDFKFYFQIGVQPRNCCIIQNEYIVFDSYDNTQDSALQPSKTMAMAWVYPTWTMSDTFIPSLQDQQVPILLNEAKALAFFEIKNQSHAKSEIETKRQLMALQKWKSTVDRPTYFNAFPDFGRRGGGYWGDSPTYPIW